MGWSPQSSMRTAFILARMFLESGLVPAAIISRSHQNRHYHCQKKLSSDCVFRNLKCQRVQLDEIWSFVYCKQKNVKKFAPGERGDLWTWIAIDSDTRLVPSWLVGERTARYGQMFVDDLAGRLANRIQLSTDGLKIYL